VRLQVEPVVVLKVHAAEACYCIDGVLQVFLFRVPSFNTPSCVAAYPTNWLQTSQVAGNGGLNVAVPYMLLWMGDS